MSATAPNVDYEHSLLRALRELREYRELADAAVVDAWRSYYDERRARLRAERRLRWVLLELEHSLAYAENLELVLAIERKFDAEREAALV
jgi:hypothetical protein